MHHTSRVFNYAIALIPLAFMAGCSVNSQILVNSNGQRLRCASTGSGIVGVITMSMHFDKCVEDAQMMGYEKIETAGVTGISRVLLEDRVLKITTITENSPAAKAGIIAGDILVSVDGQPRSNANDAMRALYGKAGTEVSLRISRGNEEKKITLLRVAYASVYIKGQAGVPGLVSQ